jgi:enoyl-CoA hydratase/carnithine racemase
VQACLLPNLIGWGRTRELLFFGDTISAQTAYDWGFVNALVAPEQLPTRIHEWEMKISRVGIQALRLQKALIRVRASIFATGCCPVSTLANNELAMGEEVCQRTQKSRSKCDKIRTRLSRH